MVGREGVGVIQRHHTAFDLVFNMDAFRLWTGRVVHEIWPAGSLQRQQSGFSARAEPVSIAE